MTAGRISVVVAAGVVLGVAAYLLLAPAPATPLAAVPTSSSTTSSPTTTSAGVVATTTTLASTTTSPLVRSPGEIPSWSVGLPWGTTPGLTMFRGNPTRSWYGTGPLPSKPPEELWRYPDSAMCASSTVAQESKVWCGTGWTGQPAVWERPDGVTEVVFGAYDRSVHFVDADTGKATRPPFPTGDLIKGSVTIDPDGFPLVYFGSRDNKLRILALDRDEPAELWSLDAYAVAGIWNNDWDGNPVIIDDVMYVGGENGWFFAIRLHRSVGTDGLVSVEPEIVYSMKGWTDELVAAVGPNLSIEGSVAFFGRIAYFANSGGRVVGVDMDLALAGADPVVFDFWVGDDVDASIVIDEEGMLYVAAELERDTERAAELGQLIKLDPARPDPFIWGVHIPRDGVDGGAWATPAVHDGFVYLPTNTGSLLVVGARSGEVVWQDRVGFHAWSSPSIVDGVLLLATCTGEMRAYSLERPASPELLWRFQAAGGCIESTPAVWNGVIYVGSRDGFMRAFR
ncbi:MAG: PQQ-binding-like beta-propeller repeat protein [Acidimicrobiia bacterium]|nr:PQQ-binding-like beta-propeller repeat protein [Acidimicrobiia bacterium]